MHQDINFGWMVSFAMLEPTDMQLAVWRARNVFHKTFCSCSFCSYFFTYDDVFCPYYEIILLRPKYEVGWQWILNGQLLLYGWFEREFRGCQSPSLLLFIWPSQIAGLLDIISSGSNEEPNAVRVELKHISKANTMDANSVADDHKILVFLNDVVAGFVAKARRDSQLQRYG